MIRRKWWLLCIAVMSAALPVLGLAQTAGGPMLFINGTPDARTAPPHVHTFVSVIARGSGAVIEGLTGQDFTVEEAASPVADLAISYEPVGLAAVIVIDRGGISRRGDVRIKEATEFSRAFLARMTADGALTDDMVAIVGVNDDEDAQLSPVENFTHNPVDKNLVGNALTTMEGETIEGGTPLYEGLDHAIALLTENAVDAIRGELRNRRKLIIVFSDGVDKNFSDEAREQDIIRKAEDHAILIYTIGMAPQGGLFSGADNLKRLAAQTDGLYTLYPQGNAEAHAQVTDLFESNGGEAHVSEIDRIYTVHGLRNDSGWEQDLPVLVQGPDIAWALPPGAHMEDAENLLWTMGASDVSIHQQSTDAEDWRTAPHPMAMAIPEEDDSAPFDLEVDEPVAVISSRKRTLH